MSDIMRLSPPAPPQKICEIHIGEGVAAGIADILSERESYDHVVLLYDIGVAHIAKKIADTIPQAQMIGIQSGDASKSFQSVEMIAARLLDSRCTRQSMILTIGGGMISDLGGLVASLFMRGIDCMHVPTTLLAMADAAIGGKTGVNIRSSKNSVGTIHQPRAVYVDTSLLRNLPLPHYREGMAEIVKIAAMRSVSFFQWLEENVHMLLARDMTSMTAMVTEAIALKVKIVEEDEKEKMARMYLNFGHTIGHALEAASAFALPHGQCVSIGMIAEMTAAQCADTERVKSLLKDFSLPIGIDPQYSPETLWQYMQHDKKNTKGMICIAVPRTLGEGMIRELKRHEFFSSFHA